MAHNTSSVGQQVDRIRVSDAPHDLYRQDGTPVLVGSDRGEIIETEVNSFTVECPACSVPAEFTEKAEPVCPKCGLICDGSAGQEISRSESLLIDSKTAGRVPGSNTAEP